jgi:hypothetical protein
MVYKFLVLILSILASILSQACTATFKITPQIQGGSPLHGIKPLTFFIRSFTDNVGNIIGENKRVYPNRISLYKPASESIRQVIEDEIKRNGHHIMNTEDINKADFIIDGEVKKLKTDIYEATFTRRCITDAEMELLIKKTSNNRSLKNYIVELIVTDHRGHSYGSTFATCNFV